MMRIRARNLGMKFGTLPTGRKNAITDIPGVMVGHSTLIKDPDKSGSISRMVRTGVSIIFPHKDITSNPVYAGVHTINGNGEVTGVHWIDESGLLTSPIGLTNTHSVGTVRDSIISFFRGASDNSGTFMLPVVGETYDGFLNDINGQHIRTEHVYQAIESASSNEVREGNIGGGTGMIAYEFKAGIGTSSRKIDLYGKEYTVGVLVQANYGKRHHLNVNGIQLGELMPVSKIPGKFNEDDGKLQDSKSGSIIVVIGTDVPLLPDQCKRLAKRAAFGLGRIGSIGENSSGDFSIAFSTGNIINTDTVSPFSVTTILPDDMSHLFNAVTEAVPEAVINSMCAAETMTGNAGRTIYKMPVDIVSDLFRNNQ
ncbi:MAG: P1 family peptidase [Spirochaetales bacterium]|nr:P1 family peptidase [Spirochaetales bacterium]